LRAAQTPAEERESDTAGLFRGEAKDAPRVSPQELHALLAGPRPPVVLDARSRGHYAADGQIPGSVRLLPDQVREWALSATAAAQAAKDRGVVAYCT